LPCGCTSCTFRAQSNSAPAREEGTHVFRSTEQYGSRPGGSFVSNHRDRTSRPGAHRVHGGRHHGAGCGLPRIGPVLDHAVLHGRRFVSARLHGASGHRVGQRGARRRRSSVAARTAWSFRRLRARRPPSDRVLGSGGESAPRLRRAVRALGNFRASYPFGHSTAPLPPSLAHATFDGVCSHLCNVRRCGSRKKYVDNHVEECHVAAAVMAETWMLTWERRKLGGSDDD